MTEEQKQDEIEKCADALSETIRKLTGADTAIIFYGYHTDKEWRYGSAGNGDIYQRIGLAISIKCKLINSEDL